MYIQCTIETLGIIFIEILEHPGTNQDLVCIFPPYFIQQSELQLCIVSLKKYAKGILHVPVQ